MTSLAIFFLYPLGWVVAIAQLIKLFIAKRKLLGLLYTDCFLLWVIYLVPMGKLVYLHVPGLIGFKFSFLAWSLACIFVLPFWLAFKRFNYRRLLIFLAFLSFPILSLILRGNFGDLVSYTVDGQSDSLGARLIALVFLMMFSVAIYDFCLRHGFEIIVRFFMNGVLTAAVIGCIIFILVFAGIVGAPELEPISADTHIVAGIFYRFNPGGNVNEFGLIAIYGLFLLRLAYPKISVLMYNTFLGLLFFALFFSLTRAAWLAFGGALITVAIASRRGRTFLMYAGSVFAVLVFLVYQLGEDFATIVVSRFALEGGASGSERLDKFTSAFFSRDISFLEAIFGHGWATNLYLHSVPLQLIYEIGVGGFLVASSVMVWALFKLFLRARVSVPGALPILGSLTAFSICSGFHHTLYHMQTWFIVGLTLYIAFSKKSAIKARNIDHENSLSRGHT